jgi:hypothetical protein
LEYFTAQQTGKDIFIGAEMRPYFSPLTQQTAVCCLSRKEIDKIDSLDHFAPVLFSAANTINAI